VLRRLKDSAVSQGLPDLGLPDRVIEGVNKLLTSPPGLVLVTGPPQSGRTHTALSLAHTAMSKDLETVCLQERIERTLPDLVQIEINPDEGMSYDRVLASLATKEPEVLVVDGGTSLPWPLLMDGALKTSLVLVTMESPSQRGFGRERASVEALAGLLTARVKGADLSRVFKLARCQIRVATVCPHCRTSMEVTESEIRRVKALSRMPSQAVFYKGTGCIQCLNTGKGTPIVLFETLRPSRSIQKWIQRGCKKKGRPRDPRFVFETKLSELVMEGKVSPGDFPFDLIST